MASGHFGRDPIEIVLAQDAFPIQHGAHVDVVMRSNEGIASVWREHEEDVGFLMPEPDVRLGDGKLLKSQVQ
jgi:hypothetical protein